MGQTEGILGGFCKRAVSVRGIRACFPDRQRHFWHLVPVMFSSGACRESCPLFWRCVFRCSGRCRACQPQTWFLWDAACSGYSPDCMIWRHAGVWFSPEEAAPAFHAAGFQAGRMIHGFLCSTAADSMSPEL